MSERMHLIQKLVILKSDSILKHFSFFAFDFNVSNKMSSAPTRLLNFQQFSNDPVYSNLPVPVY